MRFRFEGRKTFRDPEPAKVFEIDAPSVSAAIREALCMSAEENADMPADTRRRSHFTLFTNCGKGYKIILTVSGEGKSWSEAIRDAYLTVCGWQRREPDLPDAFRLGNAVPVAGKKKKAAS